MTSKQEPAEEDALSLGRRAWQEQLPRTSNPYAKKGLDVQFHLWLAGWHAEKAKSEKG